jgi:hypothetical protein
VHIRTELITLLNVGRLGVRSIPDYGSSLPLFFRTSHTDLELLLLSPVALNLCRTEGHPAQTPIDEALSSTLTAMNDHVRSGHRMPYCMPDSLTNLDDASGGGV